jgi:hypothetical protein
MLKQVAHRKHAGSGAAYLPKLNSAHCPGGRRRPLTVQPPPRARWLYFGGHSEASDNLPRLDFRFIPCVLWVMKLAIAKVRGLYVDNDKFRIIL